MKTKLSCILLVDDNEATNYIHKRIINNANCAESIDICNDGQSAIDYLIKNKTKPPSLIFLDINMPGMDGWEFLNEFEVIKDELNGKPLIFIMLTTSLNPDDAERAKEFKMLKGFQNKYLTAEAMDKILKENFPDHF